MFGHRETWVVASARIALHRGWRDARGDRPSVARLSRHRLRDMTLLKLQIHPGRRLPSWGACLGTITLGDFTEDFSASLQTWTPDDYRAHWARAAAAIRAGASHGCFVTSLSLDVAAASGTVFAWPWFREGDELVFHNVLRIIEQLEPPFDPAAPERSIRTAPLHPDRGRVSEWRISGVDVSIVIE